MQTVDAQLLAPCRHILRCQHRGVRRRFVAVRLDLHAAGDAAEGFAAGEVGAVDKRVVTMSMSGYSKGRWIRNSQAGEDAGHAEDELTVFSLGAEGDVLLDGAGSFLGRHGD